MTDPEYQRYKRNYPHFPGVQTCVALLRQSNTRGAYLDAVVSDLTVHAPAYIEELVTIFREEQNEHMRALLLSVIAESGVPTTITLFQEVVCQTAHKEAWYWALHGLKKINTKEARRVLWEAQGYEFPAEQGTIYFQELVQQVTQGI